MLISNFSTNSGILMSYIFIFVSGIVLIAIVNSLFKNISSSESFNQEYTSDIDAGRSLDLETQESETQYKPA